MAEMDGWWRRDIPRPHKRSDGMPTRSDMNYWTKAERAITEAKACVEQIGASEALTKAMVLLGEAQDTVADHVEANR